MRKIFLLILLNVSFLQIQAQITPNGNSGAATTAYTNGTPNDQIYIWCAEGIGNNTASLTATPISGTGPWTFNWFYHNQATSSWEPYSSQNGSISTVSGLPSDGYRVQIYDNGGIAAGCFTAWAWNMNTNLSASQTPVSCNSTNLNGALSVEGAFTYYNPPPPESIITAATQINVCFSATHSYVSDLAFYLIGPASAGSPVVLLSPNPGANGQGSTCNSNNNVNGLCFSSTSGNHFDPCDEDCCGFLCLSVSSCGSNYSGTYGNYGPTNTAINWSPLYGINAAEGGWAVQIFDCIGSDIGSLTNASVTFSNLNTNCGGASSINYTSGSINSAINDNSCNAASASIFQVPISIALTTPITINANVSYLWTANTAAVIPNPSSSLTPAITSIPAGNNTFTLTSTVSFGSASCSYDESVAFNSNCCNISANAGLDASFCSGGSAQLGTAVSGAIYSWSPAAGLSDATTAQPTVTLTNLGTTPANYTFTLTVTDPLDGSCSATDDVTVTVNPFPVVNAGTYAAVCIDAADVTLAGTPAGGTFSGTGVTGNTFDPSAGTQQITYNFTDGNNCSSSASATITVNGLPIVGAGIDQTICNGNSVTLNGSGATSYVWDNGVTNGISFSPSATATYTVTGTDANGCVNSDQVTVTVDPLPTAQLQDATICSGESTVLTPVLSSPAGTLLWSTNETTPTITVSPTQTTVYTLVHTLNGCSSTPAMATVTANPLPVVNAGTYVAVCIDAADVTLAGTPAGGTFSGTGVTANIFDPSAGTQQITYAFTDGNNCSSAASTTITVNSLPIVGAGIDQTICSGSSVTLNGSGAISYSWNNGVTNGIAFTPVSTATYTVIGTDANGCVNTDQAIVTVNPIPTVQLQNATICLGGNTVLTPTLSSPAGTLLWNTGATTQTLAVSPTQTTVYTLVHTLNGCSSTAAAATVTVNPLPVVNAGQDQAICPGGQVTLNASGATNYSWNNGVTNGVAFSPNSTTTYTVTGTNLNSCVNTDQVTVTVNPLPNIQAGADASICLGESIALSGSGGATYAWSSGISNGQSFTPGLGLNTYTVTGTDANGCVNTDQVTITVVPVPVADFTADAYEGYPVFTVTFTQNASGGNAYIWDLGNGKIINSSAPVNTITAYPTIGVYNVTLSVSNGICSSQASTQITVLPYPDAEIVVPNVFTPNGDNVNDVWAIDVKFGASISVEIFNRWGNLMKELKDFNEKWDGENATEGVYFYKYYVKDLNGKEFTGHGHVTLEK